MFPQRIVEGTVAALRQSGCDVQLEVYDDEDHFLLTSRTDDVIDDIVEFLLVK